MRDCRALSSSGCFETRGARRIVLATNVAETSLTVPGIKYVVDPGFARISRYSSRTKVQRLPIEPISRASADQRKGRCGRVSAGVCVRLYSEEDYLSRPEYTEAGDPPHQSRERHPADEGAAPGGGRGLPLVERPRVADDPRRVRHAPRTGPPSMTAGRSRRSARSWPTCRSTARSGAWSSRRADEGASPRCGSSRRCYRSRIRASGRWTRPTRRTPRTSGSWTCRRRGRSRTS